MTNPRIASDTYDRGIIPAETAAREEREGDAFKHVPEQSEADEQAGKIDTTGGYTVDREGLVNNFAIEPEMYIETPGDLREKEEQLTAERTQELSDINHNNEAGKLTAEGDDRGKGSGLV